MDVSELGDAAEAYARAGWAVLPLEPGGKRPATAHGVKDATSDPETVARVWAERPNCNVGIACGAASGGLVVIDLDEHDGGPCGADALKEWTAKHGPLPRTCWAMTGSGGLHMLFKAPPGVKVRPSVNRDLAVDVRGDGSYIVAPPSMHPNGKRYEWKVPPDETAPATAGPGVLDFIRHVRPARARRFAPIGGPLADGGTIGEGGRNDALFREGCSMRAKGVDPSSIRDALMGTNATRCDPPLPPGEVERIIESVLRLPEGHSPEFSRGEREAVDDMTPPDGTSPDGDAHDDGEERRGRSVCVDGVEIVNAKGKVLHNAFGRVLIDVDGACHIDSDDGAPAIWGGDRWELGWDAVGRAITRHHDAARTSERREVEEYVRLTSPVRSQASPRFIAFRNGVLDVTTGEFGPMSRDLLIPNVIPHDYVPDVDTSYVGRVLETMADGDAKTIANLSEVIGLCMFRSNMYGQCPILIGSGSNGKSVFLHMIGSLLGPANYSALDIGLLGRPFQAGHLTGKLANLGDDISNEFLKGDTMSYFKKVATGDVVYTDVKNGVGYKFRPYSTLVFSANEFPRMGDSSDGTMRRLFPVAFTHHYSPDDPDFDPAVEEKVTTEESMSALALVGICGLMSVMATHRFTPNDKGSAMAEEIKTDSDSVAQWVEDCGIDADGAIGRKIAEMFNDYANWCDDSKCMSVNRKKFTRKIKSMLGVEIMVKKLDGKPERVFARAVEDGYDFGQKS